MVYRNHSVLFTALLLMSLLLTSFNASAAAYNFTSDDICPVEAAEIYDEVAEHSSGDSDREHLILQDLGTASATTKNCCSTTCVLYPPFTAVLTVLLRPEYSLALIEEEHTSKTSDVIRVLYRPPIVLV